MNENKGKDQRTKNKTWRDVSHIQSARSSLTKPVEA
jgi:hypothetical protein